MSEKPTSIEKPTIDRYIKGGNSTFTVVSKTTGGRFTFRVQAARDANRNKTPNLWFVKARIGASQVYLGVLRGPGFDFTHGVRSEISRDEPIARAFRWFAKNLTSDQVEFLPSGKCCVCGRALTDPTSISLGVGPECAARI